MTPKEKAQELVDKYINAEFNCKNCDMIYCDIKCTILDKYEAKQCALIAVDEIIKELQSVEYNHDVEGIPFQYWQQVKTEIENL